MWLFASPQLQVLTFSPALFPAVVTTSCNKIKKPSLVAKNTSLQVLTLPHPGFARCWVKLVHLMLLPRLVLSARCDRAVKMAQQQNPQKLGHWLKTEPQTFSHPTEAFGEVGTLRGGKNCFKTSKETKKWCKAEGEELSSSWCAWGIRCPLSLCLPTAALKPSQGT